MTGELLLVGSVPLDTVEQVFRTVGGPLGPYLAYMPDGEVGDRRYWIDGIAYRVLNGHPEIETLRRPAPDENGVERWRPQGIHDQFRFRVKPGVREVRHEGRGQFVFRLPPIEKRRCAARGASVSGKSAAHLQRRNLVFCRSRRSPADRAGLHCCAARSLTGAEGSQMMLVVACERKKPAEAAILIDLHRATIARPSAHCLK